MRLLLDTEVWLWAQFAPSRLASAALREMQEPDNERFVSLASWWEISIKHGLGKLPLPSPLGQYLPSRLETSAASLLPISAAHVIAVAALPALHRDPFDRLLVAQAAGEDLVLVTRDQNISQYEVEVLWAARSRPPRRETRP